MFQKPKITAQIENQHLPSSLNSILQTVSYASTLTSTCNCYQQVNQKPISDSCCQTGATYTKSMLNPSRMGKHPQHTTILCSPCFPSMTDNIWSPCSASLIMTKMTVLSSQGCSSRTRYYYNPKLECCRADRRSRKPSYTSWDSLISFCSERKHTVIYIQSHKFYVLAQTGFHSPLHKVCIKIADPWNC